MQLCPVLSWEIWFPHKMCLGLEVFLTPFSVYSLLFGKRWGHSADSSTSSPHYLAVCFHNMSSNRMALTQLRLWPSSFSLVDKVKALDKRRGGMDIQCDHFNLISLRTLAETTKQNGTEQNKWSKQPACWRHCLGNSENTCRQKHTKGLTNSLSLILLQQHNLKLLFLFITGWYSNMSHLMTLQHRCQECSLGSPPST